MKTLEEFSKEVMSSKELQKELFALNPEEAEEFLRQHGCEATLAEIEAFAGKKSSLSDGELSQVAAGEGGAKPLTRCRCTDPNCYYHEKDYYVEDNVVGQTFQCPSCKQYTLQALEYISPEGRKF